MKNKILTFNFVLLVLVFTVASPLWATDYYVSPTGSGTTCSLASPCALSRANTNAVAGDTVYLKAGTYSTVYINPSNSGTSDSARITFRNNGTDVVTITGQSNAVYLNGRNYITIDGIKATNCTHFLILYAASHNIITNCSFDNNNNADWNHSMIGTGSQYNWITNCQFSRAGSADDNGSTNGTVLDVGDEYDANDNTYYNLIENSIFFYGGHHVVALMNGRNTFRNNYIHNEGWTNGWGNRCLYTNSPSTTLGGNVIEGNRWGYAGTSVLYGNVGNVVITSPNNIVRYNSVYHSNAYGMGFAGYSGFSNATNNKVYNNTLFNNGLVANGGDEDSAMFFSSQAGQTPSGNALKNNLYYSHYQVYAGGSEGGQTYANEFNGDVSGNPLFINASKTSPTDKTDSTIPNLNLQSNSPAINQGGSLTTVAASDTGSGTSLKVNDARYFQDGTYAPPGTVQADWIAVGTVSNFVQISSINYSTNTITLANSISRGSSNPVWLYKKSDGKQVLYGSAPDGGAYEFLPTEVPSAPRNLRIIP